MKLGHLVTTVVPIPPHGFSPVALAHRSQHSRHRFRRISGGRISCSCSDSLAQSKISQLVRRPIMPAVSQLLFLKPQPGRLEALMRDLVRAQKIVKRAGATLRAWNEVSGPNAGAIAVVIEHSDWKEFGNYM